MIEIRLKLLSDATFGRGDGVAGLVDEEIEHDGRTGLPLVRGRTLKGLLVESCADIFYALEKGAGVPQGIRDSAVFLFGKPGSNLQADAQMRVGAAQFPEDLRRAVAADVLAGRVTVESVLQALTAIRRQTAVDEKLGVPEAGSLRAMRVLLRDTQLIAPLGFVNETQAAAHLPLLAACTAGVRRGGIGRNRGRGRISAGLWQDGADVTETQLRQFKAAIGG
jgi:hypothetical protein